DGELDESALSHALIALAARHEALRVTLKDVGESLIQVVGPPGSVKFAVRDLTALPMPQREIDAERQASEFARAGFDLRQGPLWRAQLLRLSPTDHRLLLALHHTIADGESLVVLARELAELYASSLRGREPKLGPAPSLLRFARRLESDFADSRERLLNYWRSALTPLPPPLALPSSRPRPAAPSWRGAECPLRLSPELAEAVNAVSRREGVTPF